MTSNGQQYWQIQLEKLIRGAKPMLTKSMPRLHERPKEIHLGSYTITIAEEAQIGNDKLNRLDWWGYLVESSGYDQGLDLEWVVLKTERRGERVRIIWARKPRQDDSQPALAPVVGTSGPSDTTTAATAEA